MRNRCDTLRYRTLRNGRVAGFNLTLRHLLLHPPAEIQRVGVAAIDVAGVVDRDGFEAVDLDGFQNEGHDLAVLDAADPDARLVRRIEFVGRIIGHVENVVLVDEQAARPAELLPLQEIFSVLVECLNAVIGTVRDEQPAGGIHRQAMRRVELAGPGALLAHSLMYLPSLVNFTMRLLVSPPCPSATKGDGTAPRTPLHDQSVGSVVTILV